MTEEFKKKFEDNLDKISNYCWYRKRDIIGWDYDRIGLSDPKAVITDYFTNFFFFIDIDDEDKTAEEKADTQLFMEITPFGKHLSRKEDMNTIVEFFLKAIDNGIEPFKSIEMGIDDEEYMDYRILFTTDFIEYAQKKDFLGFFKD